MAGRIMLFRPQGGAAFADLRDWTGSIQLFADQDTTERFDEFIRLGLGDWIGATGEVMRTRPGELSVKVAAWRLLAETRRGFGDKWQGVHDVETRYRQREVDLWANEGVRETFLLRSQGRALDPAEPRRAGFRRGRDPDPPGVAGGANARPFVTHFNSLHADFVPADRDASSTSSASSSADSSGSTRSGRTSATRGCRRATTPSSPCSRPTKPTPTAPT